MLVLDRRRPRAPDGTEGVEGRSSALGDIADALGAADDDARRSDAGLEVPATVGRDEISEVVAIMGDSMGLLCWFLLLLKVWVPQVKFRTAERFEIVNC